MWHTLQQNIRLHINFYNPIGLHGKFKIGNNKRNTCVWWLRNKSKAFKLGYMTSENICKQTAAYHRWPDDQWVTKDELTVVLPPPSPLHWVPATDNGAHCIRTHGIQYRWGRICIPPIIMSTSSTQSPNGRKRLGDEWYPIITALPCFRTLYTTSIHPLYFMGKTSWKSFHIWDTIGKQWCLQCPQGAMPLALSTCGKSPLRSD